MIQINEGDRQEVIRAIHSQLDAERAINNNPNIESVEKVASVRLLAALRANNNISLLLALNTH